MTPVSWRKLIATSFIAGFGKSVLSAALIQHIRATPELSLAFCFSTSHAQNIHEMDGIVRTWTTQLVRQNKTSLELAFQMHQTRKTRRASRDDVWMILKDITTQIHRCVLVLDGLDEFRSDDDRRRQFLDDLKHALRGTNARILITSRTEFDIESGLRSSATEAQAYSLLDCKISRHHVRDDIDIVSKSIVARNLPKQEQHLRDELAVQLAERCDGQFLWLKFQQDQLRDSRSPKMLRAVVQAMPRRLHAIYERSWCSIVAREEPDRSRAFDTLRWLAFAYRPLTVEELAEALVVSLDADIPAFSEDDLPRNIDGEYIDGELKNLCGSLIEFREDTEAPDAGSTAVRLVHASVHDFLVGKLPLPSFIGSIPQESGLSVAQHAQLAAHCIRFLDCTEAWEPSSQPRRSFTKYAADSWFRHLQDSGNSFGPISKLVNTFMRRGNPNFNKWSKLYEDRRNSSELNTGTSFYYACLFGLAPTMAFLRNSEDNLDLNVCGGEYCTPLQAVCAMGHNKAFSQLIQWEADVTVCGGQFGNAFNAAAYHNRIDMVKGLLARGLPTHSLSTEMHGAIVTAAGQGHVEIVELLLNHGANIGSSESYSSSKNLKFHYWRSANPLHAASASSHLSIVKLLIERGADVNEQGKEGHTALHNAIIEGSFEIVELLLHHDANPNIMGHRGGALHLAARHGHLDIAMQLVDKKAILDLQDDFKRIPLHVAAKNGHAKVVEYLCTRGADANTQSSPGWTPLQSAASNGHTETAAYLIGEGVDVNLHTKTGMAALHTAIVNGHSGIASMLIRAGATLNSTDHGLTPLHLAARNGIPELVVPLIQAGVDRDARSHHGFTPLHDAVMTRHPKVIDLLLESGAVIQANNMGWTPLHNAAYDGSLEVIIRLFEAGADLHARDDEGWTPLNVAAEYNFPNIVAFFLDQGCNIDAQTNDGSTTLSIAIINNSSDVFNLLISRGADVHLASSLGYTPLHEAARQDSIAFVQSLVEKGCHLNATSTRGVTPLALAIHWGSDELIQFLIRSGAALDTTDRYGMRPLDWLQRSRPDLKISRWSSELVQDDSSFPNMAVLRPAMVRVATRLKEGDLGTKASDFYHLAHCFLLLGMEDDARVAYQQIFSVPSIATTSKINCDECSTYMNTLNPLLFFACKVCPDTDFCELCMGEYRENKGFHHHRGGHEFLRIYGPDAKFTPNDTEAFNGWLDPIVEQFKDL